MRRNNRTRDDNETAQKQLSTGLTPDKTSPNLRTKHLKKAVCCMPPSLTCACKLVTGHAACAKLLLSGPKMSFSSRRGDTLPDKREIWQGERTDGGADQRSAPSCQSSRLSWQKCGNRPTAYSDAKTHH